VIVCNHISYIDSILLISLFARHTTIVKNRLFRHSHLNWIMVLSGYLPASAAKALWPICWSSGWRRCPAFGRGRQPDRLSGRHPQPHGAIGPLNTGAFKIAKYVPGTRNGAQGAQHQIGFLRPGTFLFNTCGANAITLELLAQLTGHPKRWLFLEGFHRQGR
jgi:1-acyl-sn-glycerol-3-phosphate acyltransferase